MKTTKEIINDELGVIINSINYDVNHPLFEINKNKKWFSEEELRDKISATTIKSSRYGHEGYIDAELLKIALFDSDLSQSCTRIKNNGGTYQNEKSKSSI